MLKLISKLHPKKKPKEPSKTELTKNKKKRNIVRFLKLISKLNPKKNNLLSKVSSEEAMTYKKIKKETLVRFLKSISKLNPK